LCHVAALTRTAAEIDPRQTQPLAAEHWLPLFGSAGVLVDVDRALGSNYATETERGHDLAVRGANDLEVNGRILSPEIGKHLLREKRASRSRFG
jgi:hypothetical protein